MLKFAGSFWFFVINEIIKKFNFMFTNSLVQKISFIYAFFSHLLTTSASKTEEEIENLAFLNRIFYLFAEFNK